ncbi:MAG: UDP-N-acetylglucosamine--N-acetylmuramyl-(pentapeptide) pyrophosphoryl-undecaprenol N-acetylglucosamine transferase [Candidatus Omnitrophica bacterium]|jgi:UDP-N-acetylglucosamine--N-acetylmuramyl-(pentapeptide) pyrophosphoryl-undecaprenol N-acetylglucosamine transferase|nr:UDP-N-acetylglucosamine--N-acetylmuramyl-(pentapeptide) pyrophosphoryl-undecaprenol N-acetylglucosamine transferase [Candidatus Omnitrophota bacterium]MDD5078790.1 UDP-N-acetylglucosamine--N-acetylmuramyl-(pentapeptide) pyrophosphoryl-undecaprenol N-acetylglucosamine transferase [Candidatus Omnitrophota bacterium]
MKILAATGSSGGHIFPALAFLDEVKRKDNGIDTMLVLPRKSIKEGLQVPGHKVRYVSVTSLNLRLDGQNLRSLVNLAKGLWESLLIVIKFKPDIAVGFGSIASLPVIFWAWFFRIRTVIHEQNVIPGKANRFLVKFVDKFAVSFDRTGRLLGCCPEKIVVTGNPLRRGLLRVDKGVAIEHLGLRKGKFTLFIVGGSQGSKRINSEAVRSLAGLKDKEALQVIHLCGNADPGMLGRFYAEAGIGAVVLPFLKEVHYAYSCADLVICRAGAATVSELILFKLPSVIIPYPFAGAHQSANAGVLAEKGCAIVIEEEGLSPGKLKGVVEGFINDPLRLEHMRLAFEGVKSQPAAELLAEAVLELNA